MGSDTSKTRFQTTLDPDATTRIKTLAKKQQINDSEAIRRLVYRGLRADSRAQKISNDLRSVATNLWVLSSVVFVGGLFTTFGLRQVLIWVVVFLTIGICCVLLSDYIEPEAIDT